MKARSVSLDYLDPRVTCGVLETLLSLGTIVRDDRQPQTADAVLSWTDYDSKSRKGDASQAIYTVSGTRMGNGVKGFLAAMEKIEAVPDRAVLRLDPVCIKTKGPFPLPMVLAGQRHFARTGHEPYEQLIDVLREVVERKKLVVELIPDEKGASTDGIPK